MKRSYKILIFILYIGCALALYSCGSSRDEEKKQPTPIIDEEEQLTPIISSLSPTNKPVGSPAFTLSVIGSGFLPTSVIHWNGDYRTTTFVSSTQLTAEISEVDIASPGIAEIVIRNPSPGGGESNSIDFVISLYPYNWTYLGGPTIDETIYLGVNQIVVDSEDPGILYVDIDQYGLFISRDGGVSWTNAVPGDGIGFGVIASDPNDVNRLFYGKWDKLYVTNDRGLTWNLTHTFTFFESFDITSVKVSKLYPQTVFVGIRRTMSTFYRSQDDGASWESFSFGPSVGTENIVIPWVIEEDPVDGVLYAGFELSGTTPLPTTPFLRSLDTGETWEDITPKDDNGNTTLGIGMRIAIHPISQKVYVLPEGNVVHTSTDQGLTWKRAKNWYLHSAFIRDPNQEGRFFGGANNNGISSFGGAFVSDDDAEIFYRFGLEGILVNSLALSGDSRYLFAAGYEYGIYVTPLPPPASADE